MKPFAIATAALSCAPSFAQWSSGALSGPRRAPAAATAGPYALFVGPGDAVDRYDSRTGTWSVDTPDPPDLSYFFGAASGDLALFLGDDHASPARRFDASTATWSLSPPPFVMGEGAATSAGGKILFAQGGTPASESDVVGVYDTVSGTWSTEFLSQARSDMAATSVGGLALFAGGAFSVTTPVAVSIVDIFDTATNTWSTAALSEPRFGLAATSVGTKALFGGGEGAGVSNRVDIFDAATGTWSQATLSQRRPDLTATTVGRFALFAGGKLYHSPKSDRVDIYDSVAGTWSVATLSQGRSRLGSTAVGNRALFGGGNSAPHPGASQTSDVLDIFDAELGTLYCLPASPNSSGLAGCLRAEGSPFVAIDNFTLIAEQLPPGQFGYFITGLTQGFLQPPGSQGPICLAGNIGRYNRASEIIQGPAGALQLDLTSMPVNPPLAAMPGDTWNFQCWYRDVNPGPTSNTTNGLAVTFATTGIPSVQFVVTQASLVEDATQVEVRVTLSQPTGRDVLVPYAAGGTAAVNVDWRVEEPNPFVIPAGETRADMTLVIAEDGAQEPDELAIVSLGAPVGAVLGTASTFTLTIVDDD